MEVHPDEDDDGEYGEHANDDAGSAFGTVSGGESLLDKGDFGVGVFRVRLLMFGTHAGFLSEVRCLRSVVTP